MKFHLERALKKISDDGGIHVKRKDGKDIVAYPSLYEVYRPGRRSHQLYEDIKKEGTKAQDAWKSPHNYGIAVDIYLHDKNGKLINEKSPIYGSPSPKNPTPTYPKSWYQFDSKLAQYMKEEGFEWADKPSVGKGIGDSPHYEYHPSWPGLRGADTYQTLRDKAMQEADPKDRL